MRGVLHASFGTSTTRLFLIPSRKVEWKEFHLRRLPFALSFTSAFSAFVCFHSSSPPIVMSSLFSSVFLLVSSVSPFLFIFIPSSLPLSSIAICSSSQRPFPINFHVSLSPATYRHPFSPSSASPLPNIPFLLFFKASSILPPHPYPSYITPTLNPSPPPLSFILHPQHPFTSTSILLSIRLPAITALPLSWDIYLHVAICRLNHRYTLSVSLLYNKH